MHNLFEEVCGVYERIGQRCFGGIGWSAFGLDGWLGYTDWFVTTHGMEFRILSTAVWGLSTLDGAVCFGFDKGLGGVWSWAKWSSVGYWVTLVATPLITALSIHFNETTFGLSQAAMKPPTHCHACPR